MIGAAVVKSVTDGERRKGRRGADRTHPTPQPPTFQHEWARPRPALRSRGMNAGTQRRSHRADAAVVTMLLGLRPRSQLQELLLRPFALCLSRCQTEMPFCLLWMPRRCKRSRSAYRRCRHVRRALARVAYLGAAGRGLGASERLSRAAHVPSLGWLGFSADIYASMRDVPRLVASQRRGGALALRRPRPRPRA